MSDLRSRPPTDRDRAKWDAILKRREEKVAIEAACTRTPSNGPESAPETTEMPSPETKQADV